MRNIPLHPPASSGRRVSKGDLWYLFPDFSIPLNSYDLSIKNPSELLPKGFQTGTRSETHANVDFIWRFITAAILPFSKSPPLLFAACRYTCLV